MLESDCEGYKLKSEIRSLCVKAASASDNRYIFTFFDTHMSIFIKTSTVNKIIKNI